MKKILSRLIIGLLLLSSFDLAGAYNSSTAQSYLLSHSNNPWSTMALSILGASSIPTTHLTAISGGSAIQYEAPILAITALNQNPRTFAATDYVAALKSYHKDGQLGDPTTLNDDIFGILALVSAGEPLTDPVIVDAKNFLLGHENSDGGWGFAVEASSDTNMTASAILALLASGIGSEDPHIQNGVNYLKSSQNDDGGFPYDPYSSFGTASDSSSTAWVLWVLNALGISADSWGRAGHNPKEFLESNQTLAGYFEYQKGSGEDSFSAVTTSYAVIALSGKTLPLKIFSTTSPKQFDFRIEGGSQTVCTGKVPGPTALDIVKNASIICGFTYHIQETSFGPYLDQIGEDLAAGFTGWLYLVNYVAPSLGAQDYILKTGDWVLWYYGEFNWLPTKLTLSSTEINNGQTVTVTGEYFQNNTWHLLPEATVYFGTQTSTTNNNGQATLAPADGYYKVYAQKSGFIRSNSVLLRVGQPPAASVNLTANIKPEQVSGEISPPPSTIGFTVTPDSLDFGTLNPGTSATKDVTITNTGSTKIHVESIVSGNPLFVDNLNVGNVLWRNFQTNLNQAENQTQAIRLTVPASYSGDSGLKTGNLTFWAIAQ